MAPTTGASDMASRLNVNIPRPLHTDFKIACIKQGEDMTTVISKFISQYVVLSNKKGNKK